ncbi:MAG TPA: efflux transporter periplasmic adaptor subunit, partial [Devosia sp.]|nr:efflux transporter periplasmic adaptor subunit [Devosia sp.]
MIRQLLASLIVLAAALAAWAFFVPGASQTLANFGIPLPFAASGDTANAAPGQRPGGGRPGGARQNNVVTTGVTLATINSTLSAIGEGTATRSVTVASPVGGTLADVQVRPGQTV